ncbi:uncharacterized protein TNCV_2332901 [Trichonephila clavipes]|nr:uncharacterized protein TNCV_2332901 [Trichonephila clavipes]
MKSPHRTWGCKPRLVGENRDNSSRRWIGRGGPIARPPHSPSLNPFDFFFWGHLKALVYETLVAIVEDLTTRIVVTSADIASTPDLFERIRQYFVRRVGSAMTYAAVNLNKSCDNHLSLPFRRRAVTSC